VTAFALFRRSVVLVLLLLLLGGFLLLSLQFFGFFSLAVGFFVVHRELILVIQQQGLGGEVRILLGEFLQPAQGHFGTALARGPPHTGEVGA